MLPYPGLKPCHNKGVQSLRIRLASAVLLASAALPGLEADPRGSGNGLRLLDAAIAWAAEAVPDYRTDLAAADRSAEKPGARPSGRRLGWSPTIGYFTYRPKTYRELGPGQRAALLSGPLFRWFVEQGLKHPGELSLTPAETLRPGPLVVLVLPP